jgi:hypothetical protein
LALARVGVGFSRLLPSPYDVASCRRILLEGYMVREGRMTTLGQAEWRDRQRQSRRDRAPRSRLKSRTIWPQRPSSAMTLQVRDDIESDTRSRRPARTTELPPIPTRRHGMTRELTDEDLRAVNEARNNRASPVSHRGGAGRWLTQWTGGSRFAPLYRSSPVYACDGRCQPWPTLGATKNRGVLPAGLPTLPISRLMPSEVASSFKGSPVLSSDSMRNALQLPGPVLDCVVPRVSGPLSLKGIARTVQHQLASAMVGPLAGGG